MSDPFVLIAVGAVLGLVLGLLGGGGGILAVPALVALGEPVLVASTMSLVIVGTEAASALVPHNRAGRIDWNVGPTFGALGSVGAVLGARAAQAASAAVLLGGLTVMLLVGAYAMLRAARWARRAAITPEPALVVMAGGAAPPWLTPRAAAPTETTQAQTSRIRILTLATGVGLVTGFFGVGAGFVVVPTLVSAMRVPIKRATATALVVIVINSAVALVVRHGSLGPPAQIVALAAATAVFAVVGAAGVPPDPRVAVVGRLRGADGRCGRVHGHGRRRRGMIRSARSVWNSSVEPLAMHRFRGAGFRRS